MEGLKLSLTYQPFWEVSGVGEEFFKGCFSLGRHFTSYIIKHNDRKPSYIIFNSQQLTLNGSASLIMVPSSAQ